MKTFKPQRPRIACEFSPTQIVAAQVADNGVIDKSSVRVLPPGALAPDLLGANMPGRDAVRTAFQEAMAALGVRNRDVSVVIPDASCRLALIDLDVVPEKQEEADALIRFRLKKSLPFDVDKARVAWQVQHMNGKTNVLAAATLTTVLEEYESVVREAGCSPGVVLPSLLASLRLVDASLPTLLIKVTPTTTSIAIVNSLAVVLLRVLDRVPGQEPPGAKLADEVYPALMFFQDISGAQVQRILISGMTPSEELNSALEEMTGVCAQELVGNEGQDSAGTNQPSALGAVSGALA